jgi:hypothetical protein
MQELALLTVPTELDDTGCISQCGTNTRAARGAGSSSSSTNSAFHSSSFTWPLNGSDPSEPKMPVVGPFTTINPLANAIDVRSLGISRVSWDSRTGYGGTDFSPNPNLASPVCSRQDVAVAVFTLLICVGLCFILCRTRLALCLKRRCRLQLLLGPSGRSYSRPSSPTSRSSNPLYSQAGLREAVLGEYTPG